MRICLYGGPSSGKSTLCSHIYALLKEKGISIEEVREGSIKDLAYEGRNPSEWRSWASWHIFSEHLEREDFFLNHGCSIITDCPGFLSYIYAKRHDFIGAIELLEACKKWDKEHPSVNLFIERDDKHYQEHGRFQNLEEAKEIDNLIKKDLKAHDVKYKTFNVHDVKGIVTYLYWYLQRHDLSQAKKGKV